MGGMTGAVAEAVGMGLLHFTWIAFLWGTVATLLLAALRGRSPQLRYAVSLATFVLLAGAPLYTIGRQVTAIDLPEPVPDQSSQLATVVVTDADAGTLLPVNTPDDQGLMRYAEPAATPVPMPHVGVDSPVFPDVAYTLQESPPALLELHTAPPTTPLERNGRTAPAWTNAARDYAQSAAPWLALGWLLGVLFLGLRLLGGLFYTRTLRRRGTQLLDARWRARIEQLQEQMGIRPCVRVLQSTLAGVPVVIGWFRPIVLMPVSLFTGLPPQQVELLLAHELAHVKRLDPLVNLLQVMVETVLFFHPVVWWLSRRIREERELCCDDIALEICGGRADYAQALLHLAEQTVAGPSLAIAASDGPLRRRIHRILGVAGARDRLSAPGAMGLALLTLCGALAAGLAWAEMAHRDADTPLVQLGESWEIPVHEAVEPRGAASLSNPSPAPEPLFPADLAPEPDLPGDTPEVTIETLSAAALEFSPADEEVTSVAKEQATPSTESGEPPMVLASVQPDGAAPIDTNQASDTDPGPAVDTGLADSAVDSESLAPEAAEGRLAMAEAPQSLPEADGPESGQAAANTETPITPMSATELDLQLATKVNVEFEDVPLQEVLDFIRKAHNLDIRYEVPGYTVPDTSLPYVHDGAQIRMVKLKDTPLSEVLSDILKPLELTWGRGDDYLVVGDADYVAANTGGSAVRTHQQSSQNPIRGGSRFLESHMEDLVFNLRLVTGLRIQLDAAAFAPKGAPPEVVSRYESDGLYTLDPAFLEEYGKTGILTTVFEDGKPVEKEVHSLGAKLFDVSLEDGLKKLLEPLGLAFRAFPEGAIITTPSRLEAVAVPRAPYRYDVAVRYYSVTNPDLAARFDGHLTGEDGAWAVDPAVVDSVGGGAFWRGLGQLEGVTLLAEHQARTSDCALWWHEDPASAAPASGPHCLQGVSKSFVSVYRDSGCCGCGVRKSLHGGPGVYASLGDQDEVGLVIPDQSWLSVDRQNMLLVHELFDISRRSSARAGHRSGRRADKSAGQDRPEQSPLEENTGIVTGIAVAVDGDPADPYVAVSIQENLYHWGLEPKRDWHALRAVGRTREPVAYAWPTGVEGTYAVAVTNAELVGSVQAG